MTRCIATVTSEQREILLVQNEVPRKFNTTETSLYENSMNILNA